MSKFKREHRYHVIKRKRLDDIAEEALVECLQSWDIPTEDCVVVEHDWPIYDHVWEMIRRQVEGEVCQ